MPGSSDSGGTSGVTVRPATLDDAPRLHELISAVDIIETGAPDSTLDEVTRELSRPGVDLAADSWLAFDGNGHLVAWATVRNPFRNERINAEHYVLPGHQAAGERLIDLMTDRAV